MTFTVFWDNDGVLVDTEALYFQSNQEVLATVGITLTREFFMEQSLVRGESVFDLAAALPKPEREQLGRTRGSALRAPTAGPRYGVARGTGNVRGAARRG